MNLIYDLLQSSNIYIEIFKETMPLLVFLVLMNLYYKNRISVIEVVLYAFATEAYTMLAIGPTFTATFFISLFFLVEQLHLLITGRLYIRKNYLLLLMLPALSSLAVFLLVQMYKDPFYFSHGKQTGFYTKPLYFYLKTYLPLFAIGAKIIQEADEGSLEEFYTTIKKVARISCGIAVVQILTHYIFHSRELGEILGLQYRYLQEQSNDVFGLRVQAWFSEPKIFSAFLSLAIPVFVRDREYKMAGLALLMGVLTVSQTFWINILSAVLIFLTFPKIKRPRLRILCAMGCIVVLFLTVEASKEFFMKQYLENRNNAFYQLVFKRSVSRYDSEAWGKNNVFLGMPLQRDLELPIVEFLQDEPYLLLSGYGAGNSAFIPAHYFFGMLNYEDRLANVGGTNLNMRWFFITAEFGGIALLFFFFILTAAKPDITPFQKGFLAFVWVCFFFSQIDLFLMITALLSAYDPINSKSHGY